MDKRQSLSSIIVTSENVVPVVQQHEECLPHIKEKIDHLTKRIDTLYRMDWVIIILMVAFFGEKALGYIAKSKSYYDKRLWKTSQVRDAVVKGWITEE